MHRKKNFRYRPQKTRNSEDGGQHAFETEKHRRCLPSGWNPHQQLTIDTIDTYGILTLDSWSPLPLQALQQHKTLYHTKRHKTRNCHFYDTHQHPAHPASVPADSSTLEKHQVPALSSQIGCATKTNNRTPPPPPQPLPTQAVARTSLDTTRPLSVMRSKLKIVLRFVSPTSTHHPSSANRGYFGA